MKKLSGILMLVILWAVPCQADSPKIWDQLDSKGVKDGITVELRNAEGKQVLHYLIDDNTNKLKILPNNTLFSVKDDSFYIYRRTFNPFENYLNIQSQLSKDKLVDYSEFMKKSEELGKVFSGLMTAKTDAAIAAENAGFKELRKQLSTMVEDNALQDDKKAAQKEAEKNINTLIDACDTKPDACQKLTCYYGALAALSDITGVNPGTDAKNWKNDFSTTEVQKAILNDIGAQSADRIQLIELKEKYLPIVLGKIDGLAMLDDSSADNIVCGSQLKVKHIALISRLSTVVSKAQEFLASAKTTYLAIKDIVDTDNGSICGWIPNDIDETKFRYVCKLDNIESNSIYDINITMGSFKINTNNSLNKSAMDQKTIRVYKRPKLYAEVNVAAVYSGLKFPKYGTAASGADTVVAKAKDEDANFSPAVVLDLYHPSIYFEAIAPYLQLGLALASGNPAIMTGIGLRFNEKYTSEYFPLSISGGYIMAWADDLKNLSVGSKVSGTADLESNMTSKVFGSWYVGLQLKYKLK